MTNQFRIPPEVMQFLKTRDKVCAYCKRKMQEHGSVIGELKNRATIEHLNRVGPFHWIDGVTGVKKRDLVIACQSCNSSRGVKKLKDWFRSQYCIERNINEKTVTKPIKEYLLRLKRPRRK
jgi:hypothetical protein